MNYWLFKSEPSTYSIDDLEKQPNQTDYWDGIRNYQARNFLKDQIKVGDQAFFYHSSCPEPGITGVMEVVSPPREDHTQFDPKSDYFDAKATVDHPRWYLVDVKLVKRFDRLISLKSMRLDPRLKEMVLLKKGIRLSIMPISEAHWQILLKGIQDDAS